METNWDKISDDELIEEIESRNLNYGNCDDCDKKGDNIDSMDIGDIINCLQNKTNMDLQFICNATLLDVLKSELLSKIYLKIYIRRNSKSITNLKNKIYEKTKRSTKGKI